MKSIFVFVILICFQLTNESSIDWHNGLPWKKDLPKEEFKHNVEVRFVKRSWMPKGAVVPETGDGGVTESYHGTVQDVFNLFLSKETMYEYHMKPLVQAGELLEEGYGYKSDQESIFVIHTISGDANNYFVKNTLIAFALRNFLKNYNVFALNMPNLQASMEKTILRAAYGMKGNFQCESCNPVNHHRVSLYRARQRLLNCLLTPPFTPSLIVARDCQVQGYVESSVLFALAKICQRDFSEMFNSAIAKNLMDPDKIHLFGYCYSSQLAGYIARNIASKNGGRKVKSITALDPYSVLLSGVRNHHLSKNDAQLVYAYHTNSIKMGTLHRRATADFVLNSGFIQPGCYGSKNRKCSHRRAVTAFWYVILYPRLWKARRCSNYIFFRTCLCSFTRKADLTFPPVPGVRGTYYINTLKKKPYGYGETGANCFSSSKEEKSRTITENDTICTNNNFEDCHQF